MNQRDEGKERKIKISPFLLNYALRHEGVAEVQFHTFLIQALD
jgi:hypothetical protein